MAAPIIAIVDGDTAILDVMGDFLREEGYQTIQASNATDGFALVAAALPDMVILDLWIEVRDEGLCLLKRIRYNRRTASIPVLVCSSDLAIFSKHVHQLSFWKCAVLAKPFDLVDLLSVVRIMTTNWFSSRAAKRLFLPPHTLTHMDHSTFPCVLSQQ